MHRLKMEALTAVAAWAVASACLNVPVASNWLGGICPSGDADLTQLGETLSSTAKIYFPGSAEFEAASARWSVLEAPKVNIVVVPGTENDVAETVSFFSGPRSAVIGCSLCTA